MRMGRIVVATVLALGFVSMAKADIIMDQIGPNPSYVQGQSADVSQIFEPAYASSDVAVIDNFSITGGAKTLTEVDAAVMGFNLFAVGDFAKVTAWNVEFYSSPSAAAKNLTGDVGAFSIAPGAIKLTTPFGTDATSALAAIPIHLTLGNGTYFVAVTPVMNYGAGSEIGVYESLYGGTPSDSDAMQVNPGGGMGFASNQSALDADAAYRILGVPDLSVHET